MRKKYAILILIMAIGSAPKIFASTGVSFNSDISGEFPNPATYNNFINGLANGFKEAMQFQKNTFSLTYLLAQSYINEEVDKFSFGVNSSMYGLDKKNNSTMDGLKHAYGIGSTDFVLGVSMYFGFSVHKNLSLFVDVGINDFFDIPIGFTALWKIRQYETKGTASKLFLSLSASFNFINIYKFKRNGGEKMQFEGQYSVNSSNENIYIKEAVPDNIKHFCFMLDPAIKYNLTIKWFNIHTALGMGIQVFKVSGKYNLNTNVDYAGSGSPTGVDSSAIVNFNEQWVSFFPHFYFAISFNIRKWLRFPVIGFNAIYYAKEKKFYHGVSFNLVVLARTKVDSPII